MFIVACVVGLLCCILCLGNTMNKNSSRFEKVFFGLLSIVYLVLSIIIWVGVSK